VYTHTSYIKKKYAHRHYELNMKRNK